MIRRTTSAALVGAVALGLLTFAASTPASANTNYVPVSGSGSTWSANAVDQWRRNVNQYGMRVDYQASGSSDGRNQFRNGTIDFGVSEIPYGLKDGNVVDVPPQRKFAYMPIVAGGTAFMYNLKIGPNRVTQLRLSGDTIAKIFTGVVTNWADPAIKADNPGLQLPARKIVPVVRSDGSGTTAQFTEYLAKNHSKVWDDYCRKVGRPTPCGFTSNFPVAGGSGFVSQSGSLGVSGYVAQAQSEGAITYVEYSYSRNANFPVAKVLNKSNHYVLPTAQAVAVGLLGAKLNSDLTQNLSGVYNNPDKRSYPLSSYSYMIVPTEISGSFSAEKGRTLGDFAYYFLCQGQQYADDLGYSPLPINLVKAGLDQIRRIPGVNAQSIDITKCKNPTFSSDGSNTLAKTAPQPPDCDRRGPTQCGTSAQSAASGSGGSSSGSTGGSSSGSNAGTSSGGSSGSGSSGTNSGASGGSSGGNSGAGSGGEIIDETTEVIIDPETGEVIVSDSEVIIDPDSGEVISDQVTVDVNQGGSYVAGVPVSTQASAGWGPYTGLLIAALVMVLALIFAPPLVANALRRRSSMGSTGGVA